MSVNRIELTRIRRLLTAVLCRAVLDSGLLGEEGIGHRPSEKEMNISSALEWFLSDSEALEDVDGTPIFTFVNVARALSSKHQAEDRIRFLRNLAVRRRNGEDVYLTNEELEVLLNRRRLVSKAKRTRELEKRELTQCVMPIFR